MDYHARLWMIPANAPWTGVPRKKPVGVCGDHGLGLEVSAHHGDVVIGAIIGLRKVVFPYLRHVNYFREKFNKLEKYETNAHAHRCFSKK